MFGTRETAQRLHSDEAFSERSFSVLITLITRDFNWRESSFLVGGRGDRKLLLDESNLRPPVVSLLVLEGN